MGRGGEDGATDAKKGKADNTSVQDQHGDDVRRILGNFDFSDSGL